MRLSLFLVLALAVGAVACSSDPETLRPRTGPMVEAVYAAGTLHPADEYILQAQAEGYLTSLWVAETDPVKAGQALFGLTADEQRVRQRNSQDQLELARRNAAANSPLLREREAALAAARSQYLSDSLNLLRFRNLMAEGATTAANLDRAQVAYDASLANLRAQEARLRQTQRELALQLENAQAQNQLSSTVAEYATLRALMDGRVYEVFKERGEFVRRGEAVARLGRSDQLVAHLSIDENDITRVREGQEVLMRIDAYPDTVFRARVQKIYPMLRQAEQNFRVDALVLDPLPAQYAGLTVEANLVVSRKTSTLLLPRAVVFGGDSVRVLRDGKPAAIRIRKGSENFDFVEVLAGVDSTTDVIVR